MRVMEASVSHPMNAMGGLYVLIQGTQEEIYGHAANDLAIRTANAQGWNGNGKSTVGIPSRKGVLPYTKAYWFHDRK
ncbi:hypothetical protein M5X11_28070 [Paenibacillus alginolyticus]|uniref:hypothetical protein n=1 Tax=Paenibacillus alginolyticus TaxID=59839 RepID=UPI000429EBD4|nr:hypothetical protein [Paenibacillus alginolyticus]MCY9668735.1 hypothetical protein [Paenibacillus alginolyticus]